MLNLGLRNPISPQNQTATIPLVSEISATDKAALISRGAARTIVRSRWGRAFGAVASSLLRVGHVLWLEVTGFFFAVFTVIGGAAMIREIQLHATPGRIAVLAVFTLMFAWFAFTSFARARKRKQQ